MIDSIKRISALYFLVLVANVAHSQTTTNILTCKSILKNQPEFTVKFSDLNADVSLRGYTHKANYALTFIDQSGDTWFRYLGSAIQVAISPRDKYVDIRPPNGEIISGAFCK